MHFINNTTYNKQSLNALNQLANKTVDPMKKIGQRLLCIVVGAASLYYGYHLQNTTEESSLFATAALLYGTLFLLIGVFWVRFQNYTSMRMLTKGVKDCRYDFSDAGFASEHAIAQSNFQYRNIYAISQNELYIALFLDNKHGIIIDKNGFLEGTSDDFIEFLEEKTELTTTSVK